MVNLYVKISSFCNVEVYSGNGLTNQFEKINVMTTLDFVCNNVLSVHIKIRHLYLMKIYEYMVLYNPTHKLVVSSLFHPLWLV